VPPFRPTMKPIVRRTVLLFSFLLFTFAFCFIAHTQAPPAHGVIRLKVKYKSGDASIELARKRFFLIKGSLEDNRQLIDRIKSLTLPTRECYFRSKGASDGLIKWLKESDCESLYCREIEDKYVHGSEAVPEFKTAYEAALGDLKTPQLARRWLMNYMPFDLKLGFYTEKQKAIQGLISQAQAATKTSVLSVMTDRKGTAYLTNIEPGTYTISNLVASETEKASILWICEREVKPIDLGIAMKRPFTLSNEKDPKVKCEVIERPLPVCK